MASQVQLVLWPNTHGTNLLGKIRSGWLVINEHRPVYVYSLLTSGSLVRELWPLQPDWILLAAAASDLPDKPGPASDPGNIGEIRKKSQNIDEVTN